MPYQPISSYMQEASFNVFLVSSPFDGRAGKALGQIGSDALLVRDCLNERFDTLGRALGYFIDQQGTGIDLLARTEDATLV